MHANEINADRLRRAGRRHSPPRLPTITLEAAMSDPAYKRADAYSGQWGPSWIHRWAMAEKAAEGILRGEPKVPQWVLALAGVESE